MRRGTILAIMAVTAGLADVPAAELDEYQAKAAFLYNFAKFVEWPAGSFTAGAESVGICLLGQTPIGTTLTLAVRNKQIDGRGFVVRQITDTKQMPGCHLLFVTGGALKHYRTLRGELNGLTGLLVVGESEGFAAEGGVMNFKLEGGRLRIEVNLAEARRERLVINSRLLGMADVVGR